jgi:hypothetical protein
VIVNDELDGFCERKRSWPNFKVLSEHLSGGTEENHRKPQARYPVSGLGISVGVVCSELEFDKRIEDAYPSTCLAEDAVQLFLE